MMHLAKRRYREQEKSKTLKQFKGERQARRDQRKRDKDRKAAAPKLDKYQAMDIARKGRKLSNMSGQRQLSRKREKPPTLREAKK